MLQVDATHTTHFRTRQQLCYNVQLFIKDVVPLSFFSTTIYILTLHSISTVGERQGPPMSVCPWIGGPPMSLGPWMGVPQYHRVPEWGGPPMSPGPWIGGPPMSLGVWMGGNPRCHRVPGWEGSPDVTGSLDGGSPNVTGSPGRGRGPPRSAGSRGTARQGCAPWRGVALAGPECSLPQREFPLGRCVQKYNLFNMKLLRVQEIKHSSQRNIIRLLGKEK